MIDIPLLDDDYREAFLYLMDEINAVVSCSDNKEPWYPRDEELLEFNLRVYRRWHPDPGQNAILNFPWPKLGSIPRVPADYLKPTDEEKKKVKDFIEKNDGPDMDPFTEAIVQLASFHPEIRISGWKHLDSRMKLWPETLFQRVSGPR